VVFARRLTSDDWELWQDLRLRALADDPAYMAALVVERRFDEATWRQRVTEPGTIKVAGGAAAGEFLGILAGIVHQDLLTAEVFSVWVDPSGRGRGVAAGLLGAAEGWAIEQRCGALMLKVFNDNMVAQRLYERCGFVRTDYRGIHELSGRPEVEMVRQLGSSGHQNQRPALWRSGVGAHACWRTGEKCGLSRAGRTKLGRHAVHGIPLPKALAAHRIHGFGWISRPD
jgi:ribosomal protein S18 acetylase RimI-like enzyme